MPKGMPVELSITCQEAIKKWGNAISLAFFDQACQIFTVEGIEGIIGYRTENNCVVVFGDPVCPDHNLSILLSEFHTFCKNFTDNIIYIAASQNFVKNKAFEHHGAFIGMGDEIILNPQRDLLKETGTYSSALRQKYRNALGAHLEVLEYRGSDSKLEEELNHVLKSWLENRRGPQIYLFNINIFNYSQNRRWFYARHEGQTIGLLMINRMDKYAGWALNGALITIPDAPKSTSEMMVLSVLEVLKNEGCNFFTIGATPGIEINKTQGFSNFKKSLLKLAFWISQKFFKLSERQRYWKKFKPDKRSMFLIFFNPKVGLKETLAIMKAMNVRF